MILNIVGRNAECKGNFIIIIHSVCLKSRKYLIAVIHSYCRVLCYLGVHLVKSKSPAA